jgi:hypothetical protein
MNLVVGNFGFSAGGWRVEKHPRIMADLTGDGRADIVGFGDAGVWTALSNGDGTFTPPAFVLDDFGFVAGGWRVESHPRMVADLTGDGRGDIVGFGDEGVWVALNNGDGTFAAPTLAVANFGAAAGGWRVDRHPRFLADLTGDGRADIIGFGDGGVWVALNQGKGTFAAPTLAVANFGFSAGGWRVERHPRMLADTTGDGRPDIVGFGDGGVWVARNNGNGTFAAPALVLANFAFSAGNWRVEKHPRFMADLTGDGRADIIGFGDGGVWVSRNNGDGTFAPARMAVANFAFVAGGWRGERHPRFAVDLSGDGCADIVGFGDAGVWTDLNHGDGTFHEHFIRRDIWDLESGPSPWDPITLAYAKAVKALQARALTDPTSWTYQAAVHGRTGAVPPGAAWNECQHGSWYFLPWHRMYLHFFERIVRAEVIAQGGPSDWALPYWNYDTPGKRALPPAFRTPALPDGTPNPLFVTDRNASMNNGGTLPPSATSSVAAMAATTFTPPPAPGFGGGKTTPQHFFGLAGELEFTPHNIVHSLIGGWMGNPNLAALDPIFYLHHANVDRLWTDWLAQGGRANPGDAQWLTTTFTLHDETGAELEISSAEVLDTDLQLGYVYDNAVARRRVAGPEEVVATAAPGGEPEMMGASDRPLRLQGQPEVVSVPIDQRARAERAGGPPERIYLNLEDITAEQNPSLGYEVYVSAPRGADVAGPPPYYVGTVSFFGIEELGAEHGGDEPHGFRRTFDITAWADAQRAEGRWDEDGITVSFRPLTVIVPPGAEAVPDPQAAVPVQVGRISVFYA